MSYPGLYIFGSGTQGRIGKAFPNDVEEILIQIVDYTCLTMKKVTVIGD